MGKKPAPIEDPIGLGERLALIDYLRDEKKQKLPDNPTLEQLRVIYWKLEKRSDSKTQIAEKARVDRLRRSLEVTYAIVIPKSKTYEELLDIKKLQEDKARKELEKLIKKQQQEKNGEEPSTGSEKSTAIGKADTKKIKKAVVLVASKIGTGSGFFINSKGYLITNRHVIGAHDKNTTATIYWEQGQKREAENFKIVAVSKNRDLALLKPIKTGKQYTYLKIDKTYEVTKDILTAGYPLGASIGQSLGTNAVELTMTKGSITSVRKKENKPYFLQTEASASQGCSGGPLLDRASNKVLGIITLGIDPKDVGAHGSIMTFAIPSSEIKKEFGKFLP